MEEIDLKKFAKLAWAKKFYIVVIMIIAMMAGYFYSYAYVVPKYQSSTSLLLAKISENLNENTVDQADIADFSMTSTLLKPYISLIESKKVLKEVITNLDLKMTEDELGRMLTVREENTAMLAITVSSENPEFAAKVANEIATVFVSKAKEILNIANVNIIDKAEVPNAPYNINHIKDLLVFAILGFSLSCVFVFILYILDTTIKEEEDIENEIGLPVLGLIPVFDKKLEKNIKNDEKKKDEKKYGKRVKDSELVIVDNAKSPISEAFRTLRTNVTFAQNTRTILVTSSRMSEGKSFVTANLAVTIAKNDKKVIVVDADMRKGRQNKIFEVDNKKGLSNYLANCEEAKVDISELCSYIKTTKIPNLHLITCGSRPSNPAELLSPSKIKGLLSVLNEIYDIVIIDGTPSSIIADSVVISRYVDYTMLVTSHKVTKVEDVKKLTKSFEQVGVKINGAVLNKYRLTKEGYTSSYYYNDSNPGSKLEDKTEHTEIRTVEQFLRDANININSFRYVNAKEEPIVKNVASTSTFKGFDLAMKSSNSNLVDTPSGSFNSAKLEYKMEKIDNEITILKNMIMQIAINTNQISSKDIELIRYDIRELKDNLDDMRDTDDIKRLKSEIKEIKEFTEELIESQKDNNEKVRKFIDNYYEQMSSSKVKKEKTKKEDDKDDKEDKK